jgi:hypothetical protein
VTLFHIPDDIQIRLQNHLQAGHERQILGKYNWLGRKQNARWTLGIYRVCEPLPGEVDSVLEECLYYLDRDSLPGLYPAFWRVLVWFVMRRYPQAKVESETP